MNLANLRRSTLALVVAAFVAGCGSSDSSGGTGGTGVTTGTVTAYGSIVVNNIHFDETSAAVSINDASGSGDHRGIKIGMTVKIRGRHNGITGVAYDIEAEHAVEGLVSSNNGTDTIVVLGQTVLVDAQTLYEPAGTTFADLVVGAKVEVYGLRDQDNIIRASLIEIEDDSDFEEELRGVITDLDTDARTFVLHGLVVNYDDMTEFDDGGSIAALANGLTVEVHFNGSNYATVIEFEDNEDSAYQLSEGVEAEIEGYITSIVNATTFMVGSQVVQTNLGTTYEGGVAADIAVGAKVDVKGAISGGALIASEVEFD